MPNIKTTLIGLAALALSTCIVTFARAHHGFAFEFDPEQQGTVAGVVTDVRFTNPHVVYMIDVETIDGTTEEWLLRTHNVGVMRRLGWDPQTIEVGDRMTAAVAQRRKPRLRPADGDHIMAVGTKPLDEISAGLPRCSENREHGRLQITWEE